LQISTVDHAIRSTKMHFKNLAEDDPLQDLSGGCIADMDFLGRNTGRRNGIPCTEILQGSNRIGTELQPCPHGFKPICFFQHLRGPADLGKAQGCSQSCDASANYQYG
jgi:hypothetical protein